VAGRETGVPLNHAKCLPTPTVLHALRSTPAITSLDPNEWRFPCHVQAPSIFPALFKAA